MVRFALASPKPASHAGLLVSGRLVAGHRPRLKNFIAFVPINEQQTRYYLRVYHPIRNPFIAKASSKR